MNRLRRRRWLNTGTIPLGEGSVFALPPVLFSRRQDSPGLRGPKEEIAMQPKKPSPRPTSGQQQGNWFLAMIGALLVAVLGKLREADPPEPAHEQRKS
jgi:hypothetical protein